MSIFKNDLAQILSPRAAPGPNQHRVPVILTSNFKNSSGGMSSRDVIEVEVTILDSARQRMTPWTRIPCSVKDGSWLKRGVPRLDGPVLNDLLYSGTAPDLSRRYYLANTNEQLSRVLPTIDTVKNPPNPPFALYAKNAKVVAGQRFLVPDAKVTRAMGSFATLKKVMPKAASGVP